MTFDLAGGLGIPKALHDAIKVPATYEATNMVLSTDESRAVARCDATKPIWVVISSAPIPSIDSHEPANERFSTD